ncbi:MAG: hypothetical protein ACI8PD_002255, partial [Nitrospinales bacterium]
PNPKPQTPLHEYIIYKFISFDDTSPNTNKTIKYSTKSIDIYMCHRLCILANIFDFFDR